MKTLCMALLAAVICAGCAQGGAPGASGTGSIEMYGTLDQGITFRN
jgi:hypothetical protein